MTAQPEYDITPMGDAALLVHVKTPIDMAAQEKIWSLADTAPDWHGVREAIAGVNNLLVVFDPVAISAAGLQAQIVAAWAEPAQSVRTPTVHRIPVRYGGAFGHDLPELAAHAHMSEDDYIARHAERDYVVMSVGASPGFGYLAGMDPALSFPRRATPRPNMAAGSIVIGGAQTAVQTITAMSGWSVIGQTDTQFFDLSGQGSVLLRLGDIVKFQRDPAA